MMEAVTRVLGQGEAARWPPRPWSTRTSTARWCSCSSTTTTARSGLVLNRPDRRGRRRAAADLAAARHRPGGPVRRRAGRGRRPSSAWRGSRRAARGRLRRSGRGPGDARPLRGSRRLRRPGRGAPAVPGLRRLGARPARGRAGGQRLDRRRRRPLRPLHAGARDDALAGRAARARAVRWPAWASAIPDDVVQRTELVASARTAPSPNAARAPAHGRTPSEPVRRDPPGQPPQHGSPACAAAMALAHLGHVGVGQRAVGRLEAQPVGEAALAARDARAAVDVEQRRGRPAARRRRRRSRARHGRRRRRRRPPRRPGRCRSTGSG